MPGAESSEFKDAGQTDTADSAMFGAAVKPCVIPKDASRKMRRPNEVCRSVASRLSAFAALYCACFCNSKTALYRGALLRSSS